MVSLPTSSSSRGNSSSTTSRRRPEPVDGVPERCYCGNYAVLKTSRTTLNPGRRFYGCEASEDGGFHVFKWWDEAIIDEFGMLMSRVQELEWSNLDKAPHTPSSKAKIQTVESMRRSIAAVEAETTELKMKLAEVENKLDVVDKRGGAVELRVAVVVGFVVVVVLLISLFI